MQNFLRKIKQTDFLIPLTIALLYSLYIFQPINLVTSDLGRHIKNGEIILQELKKLPNHESNWNIFYTNYYSYTQPSENFVNHHWLSGVFFYLIHTFAGFSGLQIFNLLLVLTIVFINYKTTRKFAPTSITVFLFILLFPLACSRTEIRPEMISYLFLSIFTWILTTEQKNSRVLYFIPLIMLFWVNFHIYFILGYILLAIFLISKIFQYQYKIPKTIILFYSRIFILTVICTLCNPFLLQGLSFPIVIFKKYGYEIIENKSLYYLYNYGIWSQEMSMLITVSIATIAIIIFSIHKKPAQQIESNLFMTLFAFFLIFMGFYAHRNSNLFGFFIIIPLAYFLEKTLKLKAYAGLFILSTILLLCIYPLIFWQNLFYIDKFHTRLDVDINLKTLPIKGNIFNNYDIGGYLIYQLYPTHKIFVDNRPEAYTVDFFKETYIPMQLYEDDWNKNIEKYNIGTVILAKSDITDWGKSVLARTKADKDWKIIYEDERIIILELL